MRARRPAAVMGDAQHEVLAPRRGDQLHADRQRRVAAPHRHRADRQADERDRLRQQAEARPRRQALAVDLEPLGADCRRDARRGRRDQDVDVAQQLGDARREPAAHALRLHHPRRRQQRAGEEAVARQRLEVGGARGAGRAGAGCAFGVGDEERGGARARRPRAARRASRAPSASATRATAARASASAARGNSRRAPRCAARRRAAASVRRRRLDRPRSTHAGSCAIGALHRVVDEREVARRARERPEVIEAARRTDRCRCAAAGRRSASGRTRRTATPARGSSRWCRSRALIGTCPAATAAAEPPDEPPATRDEVVRVARRPVVRVLGREAVGVSSMLSAPTSTAPAALEARDERRVARGGRALAFDVRPGPRRQARRRRTGS